LTSLVGIICNDGIVIGTDSSATFSSGNIRTIEQETKKIDIYHGTVVVAGTGEVGLGQRFCNIVDESFGNPLFYRNKKPIEVMSDISKKAVKDFQSTYTNFPWLQNVGFNYGALVAYTTGEKFYLCEFDPVNMRPELKLPEQDFFFSSMGSGQLITDPFLGMMRKVFWKSSLPNLAGAKFIAAWTLQHAIELNAGGINGPIQMAAIRKDSKGRYVAMRIPKEELDEHLDFVQDAKTYLAKFKPIARGEQSDMIIPDTKKN
jgi:20S proteasome alpha/beta subunit